MTRELNSYSKVVQKNSGISFYLETLGFLFSTLYKVFSPPKCL